MSNSRNDRKKEKRRAPSDSGALARTQRTAQAEFDRRHDQRRRKLCNTFQFWTVCPESPCRRRKSCAGDAQACFKRWWWVLPEKVKVFFRAGIKARIAGLSVTEACRVGDEEVARSAEHIAQADAATLARLEAQEAARHGT